MTTNIELATSNFQLRIGRLFGVRCWMFDVRRFRARIRKRSLPVLLAVGFFAALFPASKPSALAGESPAPSSQTRFRGPVALVLADGGRTLLVANRRAGSVSIIDADAEKVIGEESLGNRLSGLVAVPGRNHWLLATDEAAHELLLIVRQEHSLKVIARLAVPEYPVCVQVSADGARCFVTSLWSRRLSIVDLQPAAENGDG